MRPGRRTWYRYPLQHPSFRDCGILRGHFPNHGFSIQYPFGIAVTVSTFGQIMNFSVTRCVDQCNILVIPSANTYVVGKNPFAVRTPLIPLVAVTIRIFVLAVHDGAYSFWFQIQNTDGSTVFKKGYFFAVRTVLRLEWSDIRIGQSFLFDIGCVSELFFFLLARLVW